MRRMRLRTTFDLTAWYDRVRAGGKPIAWCSAFAPAEALLALGVMPVYPENHAAMLGALSPDRDPQHTYSRAAIAGARAAGYDEPRLCTYALADLGVLAAGAASPLGSLPGPDLFYACDSQCAVVGRWGEAAAAHLLRTTGRELPHYVLHAPARQGEQHSAPQIATFRKHLLEHLDAIGRRFGLTWDEQRLAVVVAESSEANRLWQRCLELGRQRPAPWTAWDAFTAMAPIVVARGDAMATNFYRRLLAELEERVAAGVAAVPGERRRLIWDAIPIWPRRNWFARFCAERGVAVVASTYTHSWWFHFDANRALDSLAERYIWNTMNIPAAQVLDWTKQLAQDYAAEGVLTHWNRSCAIWNSYVKRRVDGLRASGLPTLVIAADMVDPAAFDEAEVTAKLERFLTT